jgi:radical SAM superfamily enzyme YgiQ (UPF0313 family)
LLKRETKHEVKMLDPNHLQLDWVETAHLIHKEMPSLVIAECSALTYPDMTMAIQLLQECGNDVNAWLCGPYGMRNAEQCLSDGWDEVFHGEYERDVLWSVQGYTLRDDQGNYRNSGGSVDGIWSHSKPYIDLDWLPWPEDEDIRRIEYSEISNPFPGMVQVYPTRGCPLACTFCVVPLYYGGHGSSYSSHRVRNIGNVCDEITYLAQKYEGKFSGCFFNEETHNANIPWLVSFCEELIKRCLDKYHYDAMCGYWTFTEEVIQLMARAGYCYIRMGIESLSSDVGKAIHKKVFPDKLVKVLEWCKKYGISTYGTVQTGAPGSTRRADLETLRSLLDLKQRGLLDRWQHSVCTPQPGTPLYESAKNEGRLLHDDISKFNGVEPVMEWDNYSADEIRDVKAAYARAEATF